MGDVDNSRARRGGSRAEEGADDAVLCVCATEVVVEDGEQRGRMDCERCRARTFGCERWTSRTTRTTYGLTSASVCDAFWMKIADEGGPSGIVASNDQKERSCNHHLFFNYHYHNALRRDKGPCSLVALTANAQPTATGTHPQSRRVRSRTSSLVFTTTSLTHGQTVMHYGWIPLIIYIGYTNSSPRPMFIKYASCLAFSAALILRVDLLAHLPEQLLRLDCMHTCIL